MKLVYVMCFTILSTILNEIWALRITKSKETRYRTPKLSSPVECARGCEDNNDTKICYYHFTLELYTVLGGACEICKPNSTNSLFSDCQCIQADGIERGSILTANRMLPGPSIQVCEGDRVVVDVKNVMLGLEVTIHWHGIHQNGTQYYDGTPFITQCPINQGNTFRYQFKTENNSGTHFWHAHTGLQQLDGLYGSLIIRQPPSKLFHKYMYDYDLVNHVLLISDWKHESSLESFPGRLHMNTGHVPDTILINGKGQFEDLITGKVTNTSLEVFTVTPRKKYRFRMINSLSSMCQVQLTVEDHSLIIIATDGQPVKPIIVDTIISYSGERHDFVIEADKPLGAYWIHVRGLGECAEKKVQQHAILRYHRRQSQNHRPETPKPDYDNGLPQGVVFNPLDVDCDQEPENARCFNRMKNAKEVDGSILLNHVDVKIYLPYKYFHYNLEQLFKPNTYNKYMVKSAEDYVIILLDGLSFVYPPSPPLSQIDDIDPKQFCNGNNQPHNCGENCTCTHKIDIPLNSVVEIILVNEGDEGFSHPFHLHGYVFYVIGMGQLPNSNFTQIYNLDTEGLLNRNYELPPGKDTIPVPSSGYVILRFKADNPGYWFLHCQLLDHINIGNNVILHVGTEKDLPPVPPGFPTCGNFIPSLP